MVRQSFAVGHTDSVIVAVPVGEEKRHHLPSHHALDLSTHQPMGCQFRGGILRSRATQRSEPVSQVLRASNWPRDWLPASELAECAETRMWEWNGSGASASSNLLVASNGPGGSRDTPKSLRKVAFGVATFSLHILSGSSFELQRVGFLGGQVRGRQTVPRAGLGRAIQALSRVDETTNIQCLIDAKYVTQGVEQRSELEYGSGGDLWSFLFRLIDGHSGKTYVIKIKSHLEDDGPSAIQQNKIAFHQMLANSLADVVAEEAARRLVPDMNLEQS